MQSLIWKAAPRDLSKAKLTPITPYYYSVIPALLLRHPRTITPSSPRRRGSYNYRIKERATHAIIDWVPAFAGMTE